MANWSDIDIMYKGDKDNLLHVLTIIDVVIDVLSSDSWLVYGKSKFETNSMTIESIKLDDDELTIYGQGRWEAPIGLFERIAEELKLSMFLYEEEPGNDFVKVREYDEGNLVTSIDDSYYSQTKIDYKGLDELLYELDQSMYSMEELKESSIYELLISNGVSEDKIKELVES